jgi:hypothetical protein
LRTDRIWDDKSGEGRESGPASLPLQPLSQTAAEILGAEHHDSGGPRLWISLRSRSGVVWGTCMTGGCGYWIATGIAKHRLHILIGTGLNDVANYLLMQTFYGRTGPDELDVDALLVLPADGSDCGGV